MRSLEVVVRVISFGGLLDPRLRKSCRGSRQERKGHN